jgi:hypothetical protein
MTPALNPRIIDQGNSLLSMEFLGKKAVHQIQAPFVAEILYFILGAQERWN